MKSFRSNILCTEQKKTSKKVCNNIMNSIKLEDKMGTMFINSENSKTTDPDGLLLNLSYKINLMRIDKYVAASNLSIYCTRQNIEKSNKNDNFKISAPT